jgi:Peptidase family M28
MNHMKRKTDAIKMVEQLCAMGMRQGKTTIQAGRYIEGLLKTAKIPFKIEHLEAVLPNLKSGKLIADNIAMPCKPTSFVSGSFKGNSALVSSLISSRYLIDVPNINFNPLSKGISRSNFYFAPSVAIRKKDIAKVADSDDIFVSVRVARERYQLSQLLVGNTKSPSTIVFAHFDSIDAGAIDNASGVAVCLSCIMRKPELLESTLVVFDPHEELSYDFPTYWGKGFRIFEERHPSLLKKAVSLIVVDSVGNGKPHAIRDKKILRLAFPIRNLDLYASKIISIGGDIEGLMRVYHSDDDAPDRISERFLTATESMLERLLKNSGQ